MCPAGSFAFVRINLALISDDRAFPRLFPLGKSLYIQKALQYYSAQSKSAPSEYHPQAKGIGDERRYPRAQQAVAL